LLKKSQIKHL